MSKRRRHLLWRQVYKYDLRRIFVNRTFQSIQMVHRKTGAVRQLQALAVLHNLTHQILLIIILIRPSIAKY